MGEETIKKVLKDFGLTEIEAEVYLFLGKHNALKGTEIARQINKDKGQVYHILKSLQAKGLVESTLEVPVRFTPVPFENVVESTIRAKRDEAARIESTKKELFEYWKNISKAKLELPSEKFMVIEGRNKAYFKISQMIRGVENQLSVIMMVPDLLRADRFGVFDAVLAHPLRSKIHFRFLTDISNQNVNTVKTILEGTKKAGIGFKVRNPELGLQLSPRMVLKDNDEMLFFITNEVATGRLDDVCLWTDCKELVHSFSGVFDDLWRNSIDIQAKLAEIETGKQIPQTYTITDSETARKKYNEILEGANEEVVIMTSAEGLIGLSKKVILLRRWATNGVFVKILAPIVKENYKAAQHLSESCYVKHIPASYLNTTVVDGQHLFQFKNQPSNQEKAEALLDFQNAFYSDDFEYVDKTKNMLNDIWKSAGELSDSIILPLMELTMVPNSPSLDRFNEYRHMMGWLGYPKVGAITEKEIITKIVNAKRIPAKDPLKDIVRYYGSRGIGVIHPPENFNLPDMIIIAFHFNKQSSFGAEDRVMVYLRLDSPKGQVYLPVAAVGDNPDALAFLRGTQVGTPSAQTQLVKKDELQVRLQGNTLFAGWTVPIKLYPPDRVLPPACMLIEAYGDIKTAIRKSISPSGRIQVAEFTFCEASLTFFHPSSKYSGPGTDAFLHRDCVGTTYPPSTGKNAS